jgi:hypothetical protein
MSRQKMQLGAKSTKDAEQKVEVDQKVEGKAEQKEIKDVAVQQAEAKLTPDAEQMYIVADKVKSLSYMAGIKSAGDKVNPEWPEYKNNEGLLEEHLEKGLIKKA